MSSRRPAVPVDSSSVSRSSSPLASLFIGGYLILSALLPAGVIRRVGEGSWGTASGILYTAQFMGAFAGGTLAGLFLEIHPGATMDAIIVAAAVGLFATWRLSTQDAGDQRVRTAADPT